MHRSTLRCGRCCPVASMAPAPCQRYPSGMQPGRRCARPLRLRLLRAWQQVTDPVSGKPYYWNTATNETAWELPAPAAAAATPAANAAAGSSAATTSTSSSFPELFALLQAAYDADGSGMQFWEAARAHRGAGVFDEPFFDFLAQQQGEKREPALKMMARLSNPLLRQPAPFEF